jgi:hypothetical protein
MEESGLRNSGYWGVLGARIAKWGSYSVGWGRFRWGLTPLKHSARSKYKGL